MAVVGERTLHFSGKGLSQCDDGWKTVLGGRGKQRDT